MDITARYKDDSNLGGLNLRGLQGLLNGGDYNVQRLGTSGDYEMP
jgi:hypothetical protein